MLLLILRQKLIAEKVGDWDRWAFFCGHRSTCGSPRGDNRKKKDEMT